MSTSPGCGQPVRPPLADLVHVHVNGSVAVENPNASSDPSGENTATRRHRVPAGDIAAHGERSGSTSCASSRPRSHDEQVAADLVAAHVRSHSDSPTTTAQRRVDDRQRVATLVRRPHQRVADPARRPPTRPARRAASGEPPRRSRRREEEIVVAAALAGPLGDDEAPVAGDRRHRPVALQLEGPAPPRSRDPGRRRRSRRRCAGSSRTRACPRHARGVSCLKRGSTTSGSSPAYSCVRSFPPVSRATSTRPSGRKNPVTASSYSVSCRARHRRSARRRAGSSRGRSRGRAARCRRERTRAAYACRISSNARNSTTRSLPQATG